MFINCIVIRRPVCQTSILITITLLSHTRVERVIFMCLSNGHQLAKRSLLDLTLIKVYMLCVVYFPFCEVVHLFVS